MFELIEFRRKVPKGLIFNIGTVYLKLFNQKIVKCQEQPLLCQSKTNNAAALGGHSISWSLRQWFSDVSIHQNHLEVLLKQDF